MARAVLITTSQPSINPRLTKEAISLCSHGYQVTVLCSNISDWAFEQDQKIIQENAKISWQYVDKKLGFYNKLRFRLFRSLYNRTQRNMYVAINSEVRNISAYTKILKNTPADIYVAHNLGALPIAAEAAHIHKAKLGYDAEDFYRGQYEKGSIDYKRAVLIEDRFIPRINYLTAASSLILNAYKAIYNCENSVATNNVFSIKHLKTPKKYSQTEPLKLFWFSQTVGKNRGLEEIIEAMGKLIDLNIKLTILGNISDEMKIYLNRLADNKELKKDSIIFHPPTSLEKICDLAAQHDLGIAIETENTLNRDICLTNKIFVYVLSGLPVVANTTSAQQLFFKKHSALGFLFDLKNDLSLSNLLRKLYEKALLINDSKEACFSAAKSEFNWEIEQHKFLSVVNKAIN